MTGLPDWLENYIPDEELDNKDGYENERISVERGIFEALQEDNQMFQAALKEILMGYGRFDLDHLIHCENTIEDMKAIAVSALSGDYKPKYENENDQENS